MTTTTETTSVLQSALSAVIDSAEFRRVLDQIKRGARVVSISGLVAAPARALALAALQKETGKQFALVVPAQRDLEDLGARHQFLVLRFARREPNAMKRLRYCRLRKAILTLVDRPTPKHSSGARWLSGVWRGTNPDLVILHLARARAPNGHASEISESRRGASSRRRSFARRACRKTDRQRLCPRRSGRSSR